MSPIRHLLRSLAVESGFTMIITLGVLLVSSLLMTAAFVAANGDINLTHNDSSAKKAYYAAEAGISDYAYHLNVDDNYWTYCTGGSAASNKALNLEGSTANKVPVPGASEEEYAIQLLHASTSSEQCNKNNPTATMIESGTNAGGTFRIESTGYSGKEKRTIVATFAHTGFLNFIYYTEYETLDPNTYEPVKPECKAFRAAREKINEKLEKEGKATCSNIDFISADQVNGPLHTEDTAEICGEPTFGRGSQDVIEFKGGTTAAGGCTDNPNILGTLIPEAKVLSVQPPPSNVALKEDAAAAYQYKGKTVIDLEGETMTVTNKGVTKSAVPFPSNGVIYVFNETCSGAYTPYDPSYSEDTGCGNVYVSGNYTKPLTIGAENDVVINDSVTTPTNGEGTPTTNAVLGLIANNFVRVYHPVKKTYEVEHYTPKTEGGTGSKNETCKSGFEYNKTLKLCVEKPKSGYTFHASELVDSESCNEFKGTEETYLSKGTCEYENSPSGCDAPNLSESEDPNKLGGSLSSPTIDAAILAVNHSFIVDNFKCGEPLGELNVFGAIAQIFRGTVGTHNGSSVTHGYAKNYSYDDRLQVESPPYFLNPVEAAWHIRRETLAP